MSADDWSLSDAVSDVLESLGFEELSGAYTEEHEAAERTLADAFDPLPESLSEVPEVHEVNKVNTHDDGGDVLVPVVPFVFEDPGEPNRDEVWSITGTALQAVHPAFAERHVRHYDLQFAYADEDEETVVYRRITVHPPLVERYLSDPGFDLADLREAVAKGDDGDDGVPPVNFKQFDARSVGSSGAYSGGSAAAMAAASAASTGAAASCAGAAAGAGAGGGCGGV